MGKRYLLAQIAQQMICGSSHGSEKAQRTRELISKAQHPDLWSAPFPGPLAKEHAAELQAHLPCALSAVDREW